MIRHMYPSKRFGLGLVFVNYPKPNPNPNTQKFPYPYPKKVMGIFIFVKYFSNFSHFKIFKLSEIHVRFLNILFNAYLF